MTTVGRWSPNKVRARVLDGTWASPPEELGGMVLLTPTSIAYTGTSASIAANGSVEFTACSQLRLNGVFSANYDNYMIVFRQTTSQSTAIEFRLSSGGADDLTANSYIWQYLQAISSTLDAGRVTSNYARVGVRGNEQRAGFTTNVYGPHLVQPTAYRSVTSDDYQNATFTDFGGTHNQSTSYDGINIYPTVGNMTGLASVFGLVGA